MKGEIRRLATQADIERAYAMVAEGQMAKADLLALLAAVEARGWIDVPALSVSGDRKTVAARWCAELVEGAAVRGGGKVKAVSVEGDGEEAVATVALTAALAEPEEGAAERFAFESPLDPFAEIGTTREYVNGVKEGLKNHE
jgi:hypothetical protein